MLASCNQASPTNNTDSTDAVSSWIQRSAIPLKTSVPGESDADLQPLVQKIGNATIVGLGEETHGTHEFFDIKARITEFLITKMGFSTFVMENNWGISHLVDSYINGGRQKIDDVLSNGLFRSWQTQEYRDILQWMRAYNADPAHSIKIHYIGMDCQSVSQSDFDGVENYIHIVDPQQTATIQQQYKDIITSSIPSSNLFTVYYRLTAQTKQAYVDHAQRVYDLLKSNQATYEKHSSSQAFALALQNARVVVQATTYLNQGLPSDAMKRYVQRDGFMAENVAWIHDHIAGNNSNVIVWAHDAHIANNTSYLPAHTSPHTKNMGAYLRIQYKEGYLSIGTSLFQGSATFYSSAYMPQTKKIAAADKQTYNYTPGNAGPPLYMLDLRETPAGAVTNWANGPQTFQLYGLGGEDLSSSSALKQWFDIVVNIRNTTAAHSLLS
jgi:erythromycin esterase